MACSILPALILGATTVLVAEHNSEFISSRLNFHRAIKAHSTSVTSQLGDYRANVKMPVDAIRHMDWTFASDSDGAGANHCFLQLNGTRSSTTASLQEHLTPQKINELFQRLLSFPSIPPEWIYLRYLNSTVAPDREQEQIVVIKSVSEVVRSGLPRGRGRSGAKDHPMYDLLELSHMELPANAETVVSKLSQCSSPVENGVPVSRIFKQYLLTGSLGGSETRLALWSVPIKLSDSAAPVVKWNQVQREFTLDLAPRESLLSILHHVNLSNPESVFSSLLAHDMSPAAMMANFAVRDFSQIEHPSELLHEGTVPIFGRFPVLLKSCDSFTDVSPPHFTRAQFGEEEAVNLFVTVNFARKTLQVYKHLFRHLHFLKRLDELLRSDSDEVCDKQASSTVVPAGVSVLQERADELFGCLADRTTRRNQSLVRKRASKSSIQVADATESTPLSRLWPPLGLNLQSSVYPPAVEWGAGARSNVTETVGGAVISHYRQPNLKGSPVKITTVKSGEMQFLKIAGTLSVTDSAVLLAMPVKQIHWDVPIKLISLPKEFMFKVKGMDTIKMFATSYRSTGSKKSLGFLLKLHCSNSDGNVCHMPCYPPGWRSECELKGPGTSAAAQSSQRSSDHYARGREQQNVSTAVILEGENFLESVAALCDNNNPEVLSRYRLGRDCARAGMSRSIPFHERMSVPGCNKIEGTGNASECMNLINKHVLSNLLPELQEQYSTSSPLLPEIGKLFPRGELLFVVGKSITEVVEHFRNIGLMPPSIHGFERNEAPSLLEAIMEYCRVPLGHYVTDAPASRVLLANYDLCFRGAHIYAILDAIGMPETVVFKTDIRRGNGKKVTDLDFQLGSLVMTLSQKLLIKKIGRAWS